MAANAHIPKNNVDTIHKVIRFGTKRYSGYREEMKLYEYFHQRADFKVSRGAIPVGFYSCLTLKEGPKFLDAFADANRETDKPSGKAPPAGGGYPIYLETRSGEFDERGAPRGPQYQVTWKQEKEVVPPVGPEQDGWHANLDELWTSALGYWERKNLLNEESLEYLDADPFVLFGVDDPVTQEALNKLEVCPALVCDGAAPTFEEYARYLRINPGNKKMHWLVTAFQETDLPKPWTCYKGVGSICCFIRSDTGKVTWVHPYYSYFDKLRGFCEVATEQEVQQIRCNRLLWTYEATRVETDHNQEPLISPEYIERLGNIFGHDLKESGRGAIVRNLKAQLKVFAREYRKCQNIDMQYVKHCSEILQRDVEKYKEMYELWSAAVKEDVKFDLAGLANGQLSCVNCEVTALCFCLECKDYLCPECYELLHNKGARLHHAPFRLVRCCMCVYQPAKLHCSFTDKSLCHQCYAMQHIKMLPPDGKENQPRRIDYLKQYQRYAEMAQERLQKISVSLANDESVMTEDERNEALLNTDWHPFFDSRGVKFYHNFTTGERMRQSPRRVPNTEDMGAGQPAALMDRTEDVTSKPGSPTTMSRTASPAHRADGSPTKGTLTAHFK